MPNLSPTPPRGFTLIELILALSLSVVLVALLASALNYGLGHMMQSRQGVERARLVDGVLTLIASDIQSGVIYTPQDVSSAMEIAKDSSEFDVDSIDSVTSSAGGGSIGGSAGSASGSTEDEEPASLRRPLGVYGRLDQLQIDILREHPQLTVNQQGEVSAASATGEITTVTYRLGEGLASLGSLANNGATHDGPTSALGLVRQEVHRDRMSWAEQMGSAADLAGEPLLIAAEVARLEFRYFDGVDALESWDSELQEGQLPRAIELRVWFYQVDKAGNSTGMSDNRPYVLTVALPAAWNDMGSTTSEESADSSGETESASTPASSGGNGFSGGVGGGR